MAELTLDENSGEVVLTGELIFSTVPDLLAQEARLMAARSEELKVDLAGVERGDSAGLALLVAWLRAAKKHNKRLVFLNVPAQLQEMAKVSGLEKVLSLA